MLEAPIQLTNGMKVRVDIQDFAYLSKFSWSVSKEGNKFYAQKYGIGKMHRFILGLPRGDKRVVDHINGDGLDNRRSNLRLCTRGQNLMNKKPNRKGSSAFKGVSKRRDKFVTKIRLGGKDFHIGTFTSEVEAAKAYDHKARELFGEFAWCNFV